MARRCWARSFSECSDQMSGEHLVSKALFPAGVTVRGFSWCKGEAKTVGVNALTAKVLCMEHNSMLSSLDAAAKDAWCVLRHIAELNADHRRLVAAGISHRSAKVRFRLDGWKLERWAFKTTVNMVASGNRPGFPGGWEPNAALVRHIFGEGTLPDGCGLGVAVVIGEPLSDLDHISFDVLKQVNRPADQPEVEGFLMGFRGLRLAGSSTMPLSSLHTPTNPFNPEQVLVHLQRINFAPTARVDFDWSGKLSGEDKNVRRARDRFDRKKR